MAHHKYYPSHCRLQKHAPRPRHESKTRIQENIHLTLVLVNAKHFGGGTFDLPKLTDRAIGLSSHHVSIVGAAPTAATAIAATVNATAATMAAPAATTTPPPKNQCHLISAYLNYPEFH